jgi:hypothetical protein
MVAWVPIARTALKVAPVVLEVGRQLDKQLRPHVLAYRLARDVDGYVARWSGSEVPCWLVFPSPDEPPLRAFPPVSASELETAAASIAPETLSHWSELPEAKLAARGAAVAHSPKRAADKLRRVRPTDDHGASRHHEILDAEVVDIEVEGRGRGPGRRRSAGPSGLPTPDPEERHDGPPPPPVTS